MTDFEEALAEFCWDVQQIIDGKGPAYQTWFCKTTGLCCNFEGWLWSNGRRSDDVFIYSTTLSRLFYDKYGSANFPFNNKSRDEYHDEGGYGRYRNPKRLAFIREWAAKITPTTGETK